MPPTINVGYRPNSMKDRCYGDNYWVHPTKGGMQPVNDCLLDHERTIKSLCETVARLEAEIKSLRQYPALSL